MWPQDKKKNGNNWLGSNKITRPFIRRKISKHKSSKICISFIESEFLRVLIHGSFCNIKLKEFSQWRKILASHLHDYNKRKFYHQPMCSYLRFIMYAFAVEWNLCFCVYMSIIFQFYFYTFPESACSQLISIHKLITQYLKNNCEKQKDIQIINLKFDIKIYL